MMAFQQELDYSRARNALQVRPAMAGKTKSGNSIKRLTKDSHQISGTWWAQHWMLRSKLVFSRPASDSTRWK